MNFTYRIFFVGVALLGSYSVYAADQRNEAMEQQFVRLHFSVPHEVKSLVCNGGVCVKIPIESTVGGLIKALQTKLHMPDAEFDLMCEGHMECFLSEDEKIKWTTTYVAIRKPKKQV